MPATTPKTKRRKATLPPWNVILHNDDNIDFNHVVLNIQEIIGLTEEQSSTLAREAHESGLALIMTTHFEKAELVKEKFSSCLPPIPVTIEPAPVA